MANNHLLATERRHASGEAHGTLFPLGLRLWLKLRCILKSLRANTGTVLVREAGEQLEPWWFWEKGLSDHRDLDLLTHPTGEFLSDRPLLVARKRRRQGDKDSLRPDCNKAAH